MGKLNVIVGNIVDDQLLRLVDAVVLPTNPMMRCGCGVSGAMTLMDLNMKVPQ